ncbi:MAG: hypothetical protein WD690_09485 [Vicinamibacterales bacterium]
MRTHAGPGIPFELPLRAEPGDGCASPTGVQHTVKFWIGPRGAESGATYTLDTFRIGIRQ